MWCILLSSSCGVDAPIEGSENPRLDRLDLQVHPLLFEKSGKQQSSKAWLRRESARMKKGLDKVT